LKFNVAYVSVSLSEKQVSDEEASQHVVLSYSAADSLHEVADDCQSKQSSSPSFTNDDMTKKKKDYNESTDTQWR